jgi:hypothetical protein
VCAIAILFIWNSAKRHLENDQVFPIIAIADLLSLFFILLSLWFTVQKFFYVKLDAALSFMSLIFIIGGLSSTCSISFESDTNDIFYIIVCFAQS